MESSNRNLWIVIAVILVLACCCALAFAAALTGWFATRTSGGEPFDLGGPYREQAEGTFAAGDTPVLEIDLFAGSVTVRPGESDEFHVVAVSKASSRSNLRRIDVQMTGQDGGVLVKARKQGNLSNASVDVEITAPASARLEVRTGAGTIDVRGVHGGIDVHSGAGTIEARDVSGQARIGLGAGEITYEGRPAGSCRFETGVGAILLKLPEDLDVEVDVGTGLGSISVDYAVDGRVTTRDAWGVIGDGSQGSIFAHTGAGNVTLSQQRR